MSFVVNMANNNDMGVRVSGISDKVSAAKKDSSTLYVGALTQEDGAAANAAVKRESVRKQAKQLINSAWNKDKDIAGNMDKLEQLKKERFEDVRYYNKMMAAVEDRKKQLMEDYGVKADSAEQKDLELLERYQNNRAGIYSGEFSKEDIARLKELQHTPRTEYQDKVLELNAAKNEFDNAAYQAEQLYRMTIQQQSDAYINQPKQETMLNAKKAEEALMAALGKDILAEYIKEGMDEIEENIEDITGKAEEAREERKEREEKLEEAKEERKERLDEAREEREEQEELLDDIADSEKLVSKASSGKNNGTHVEDARQQVVHLMKRSNLVNEDLMGIEIDLKY